MAYTKPKAFARIHQNPLGTLLLTVPRKMGFSVGDWCVIRIAEDGDVDVADIRKERDVAAAELEKLNVDAIKIIRYKCPVCNTPTTDVLDCSICGNKGKNQKSHVAFW